MTMFYLLSRGSLAIIASIVMAIAGMGSAEAQHGHHSGGHGFGHGGGHGIGYGGHGFGHGGHGFGHGGHGFGHGIGHAIEHDIGHGIGHGNILHGGHVSHHSSLLEMGYSMHPHVDVHSGPYYAGYGHVHTPYYDYYHPLPANVIPSAVVSPPVIASTPNVTTYSAAKPVIPSNAPLPRSDSVDEASNPYRSQAKQAFQNSDYSEAVRLANHALVESPNDGKLMLLYAQGLFAVGDYQAASGMIHRAASVLNPGDWGYVVENYSQYYRGNGFVDQMNRLESFLKANPEAAYARFLRGYQFGFLGQSDVAVRELNRALELESRDQLAAELVSRFGGIPVNLSPGPLPRAAQPEVQQTEEQRTEEPIRIDTPPPVLGPQN